MPHKKTAIHRIPWPPDIACVWMLNIHVTPRRCFVLTTTSPCFVLTTTSPFLVCTRKTKAHNVNWVDRSVPFFIPFSKNHHSDVNYCRQWAGHKLRVHLLLIDKSNLLKALSQLPVNTASWLPTSDVGLHKALWTLPRRQRVQPVILCSETGVGWFH